MNEKAHTRLAKVQQICWDPGRPDRDGSYPMVAPKLLQLLAGATGAAEKQPAEHAEPAALHAGLPGALQSGSCWGGTEHRAAVVRDHWLLVLAEVAGSVPAMKKGMPGHLPELKMTVALGDGHSSASAACWCPAVRQASCCEPDCLVCADHVQSTAQGSLP